MTTVDQALSLLNAFSMNAPEHGLTELAASTGFDKAKTRRYLLALIRCGFIEQNRENRKYRLGAALLSLARIRESCFPLETHIGPILTSLVEATGETAHFSFYANGKLSNVFVLESPKAHRVSMQVGDILPLHATASGLAYLAFSEEQYRAELLKGRLKAYTGATITDKTTLSGTLKAIRKKGIATANGTYDEGVSSFAIPVFGNRHEPRGSLAIAAPASRVTGKLGNAIESALERTKAQLAQITMAIV